MGHERVIDGSLRRRTTMAAGELLLRVRSRVGESRVTAETDWTVAELRDRAAEQLGGKGERLSKDRHLLVGDGEAAAPMADEDATIGSCDLRRGDVVYLRLSAESEAALEATSTATSRPKRMTIEELVAKQVRIERQKDAGCALLSMDRNAASQFQSYVGAAMAFSAPRCGWLYGTADDERGVHVDFIYEPPQQADKLDRFYVEASEEEKDAVETIAQALGVKKVGVILAQSQKPREYIMSDFEIQWMAREQALGDQRFVTAVVSLQSFEDENGKESKEVHFEAFQLSDTCMKLYREGWFVPQEEPSGITKVNDDVIVAGKDVREIDNDFFLVPVKITDYASSLSCSFPIENRLTAFDAGELKAYLRRTAGKDFNQQLSDFHLLFFLSKHLDINDVKIIAESIHANVPIMDGYRLIIESIAQV